MEINNPKAGKSDHQIVWSINELQVSSSSHGNNKSYTCSFCKRGFSNAQALGGHMNVHRKDRAKLKQASDENLLSLDIAMSSSITSSIYHPQVSEYKSLFLPSESSDDRSDDVSKTPSLSIEDDQPTPGDEDAKEKPQQLSLFVDRKADDHEDKKMQSSETSSQGEILDLELRLGPEPHETSSTQSTREFF